MGLEDNRAQTAGPLEDPTAFERRTERFWILEILL